MKKVLILFAAVAMLAACGTKKTTQTTETETAVVVVEPAALEGEWTIAQVGETLIADSIETLVVFHAEDSLYGAFVGCNRINGTYIYQDSLVLTDGLSTKMYCEGVMELEQTVCATLPQVKHAIAGEDGTVLLQDAIGETLFILKAKE